MLVWLQLSFPPMVSGTPLEMLPLHPFVVRVVVPSMVIVTPPEVRSHRTVCHAPSFNRVVPEFTVLTRNPPPAPTPLNRQVSRPFGISHLKYPPFAPDWPFWMMLPNEFVSRNRIVTAKSRVPGLSRPSGTWTRRSGFGGGWLGLVNSQR